MLVNKREYKSMYNDEYYCPNCNAILNDQEGFDPELSKWECTQCGRLLTDSSYEDGLYGNVVWYCDKCGADLTEQSYFSEYVDSWTCTECGYINPINEDEILDEDEKIYKCPSCGFLLNAQDDFEDDVFDWVCTECDARLHRDFLDLDFAIAEPMGLGEAILLGTGIAILNVVNNHFNSDDTDAEYDEDNEDEYDEDYEDCEAYENATDEREDEILSKELQARIRREKKEKKKAFRKKHWRLYVVGAVLAILLVLSAIGYYEIRISTTVGVSSEKLIGENYSEVVDTFETAGFTNINAVEIADLNSSEESKADSVSNVSIWFIDSFNENTKFPSNAKVTISYHTMKDVYAPLSAKELKGKNVKEVQGIFAEAGFENIECKAKHGFISNLLNGNGDVNKVSIDEDDSFNADDVFKVNSKVVIEYNKE